MDDNRRALSGNSKVIKTLPKTLSERDSLTIPCLWEGLRMVLSTSGIKSRETFCKNSKDTKPWSTTPSGLPNRVCLSVPVMTGLSGLGTTMVSCSLVPRCSKKNATLHAATLRLTHVNLLLIGIVEKRAL